ncbi:MAG: DUF2934 domain-containing protein [Alphaproteobacteria bacterium]|nr:DUF2934 domain-containing protein [Alphaproteobacteria bacterium]
MVPATPDEWGTEVVEVVMAQQIPTISDDEIRLRSYLIWQREGCPSGAELTHWLRARAELETEHDSRLPRSDVIFRCDGPHPVQAPPVPPRVAVTPPPRRITAARISSGTTAARR